MAFTTPLKRTGLVIRHMETRDLVVSGARVHNLRDIDVTIPKDALVVFTGVSGSGKSSLAFDTLYAEGQRRYVESLSTYARQFLGQMEKPDVDKITGLSPAISIEQRTAGRNPRSTVGTVTEIHDYLRVLYSRVGTRHCVKCGVEIGAQTREQIISRILSLPKGTRYHLLAPIARGRRGEFRDQFADALRDGFIRARVDGETVQLTDDLALDKNARHDVDVVVDRLVAGPDIRGRLADSVDAALRVGEGTVIVELHDGEEMLLSSNFACHKCGISYEELSPAAFSFNSPQGMCRTCNGLGTKIEFDEALLIPDKMLSIPDGAIAPFGPIRNRWRLHIYQGVAEHYGFPLSAPWRDLPAKYRNVLLHGSDRVRITYTFHNAMGGSWDHKGPFDGIIPELMRKYSQMRSDRGRRFYEGFMTSRPCPDCGGERLRADARAVRLGGLSIGELCALTVDRACEFFEGLTLDDVGARIAEDALKEVGARLRFLLDVGLHYLTLDRSAPTLAGGEAQRIRLASQIGSGLVGVLYILDEPSIGLHHRDNERLLQTLVHLRDMGNTVIVVEHDEDTMRRADHIVDFGPGPGVNGGEIVVSGPPDEVEAHPGSITGHYLAGERFIPVPAERRELCGKWLTVHGARHNNLKDITARIPLGVFTCVTGVSGSGKSSLVGDIIHEALARDLNGAKATPGRHKRITGLAHLDKVINIDQSPIGRTPRSNPATYVKALDPIRKVFSQVPQARALGYKPGRFSFNVKGGRCEACDGNGANRLEMDFLADVWVTCPVCAGKRFNRETLAIRYKGFSITDVLEMDVAEAVEVFANVPGVRRILQTLHDVGLDYIKLGQSSTTLSGGEAQRVKLARELCRRSTGRTVYILDEPTTGLHFADVARLLDVLHTLADAGNTVIVIEHNMEVVKTADWILDLGPEGGEEGGDIVAEGRPEEVAAVAESYTGQVLAKVLADGKARPKGRVAAARTKKAKRPEPVREIEVIGAREHNLRSVSLQLPRERMTVFSGVSGSGKTSLALDTIYAEGRRRYVESLSAYARQFLGQMHKPKVDHVTGLSPSISIEQKSAGGNPRSTLGTITEIYDYIRVLYARLAVQYCPACGSRVGGQALDQIVDRITGDSRGDLVSILAPLVPDAGEDYATLFERARRQGFVRARVNGEIRRLEDPVTIDKRRRHEVEIVVDRLVPEKSRRRLSDSVEVALQQGEGTLIVLYPDGHEVRLSERYSCSGCGRAYEQLRPQNFSFNSPLGWCTECEGLGTQRGTDVGLVVPDPGKSLREGAITLLGPISGRVAMLMEAVAKGLGISLDAPFDSLTDRQKNRLMHGAGERWLTGPWGISFRWKGLFPAIDKCCRHSWRFQRELGEYLHDVPCQACGGARIRPEARSARLSDRPVHEVTAMTVREALSFFDGLCLDERGTAIAGEVLREIRARLSFLLDVGLHYLSLDRRAPTLAGGEAQRIRLASQLGSGLTGVLYVLDEPTIGLHHRDNEMLLAALRKLRDLGNTLIVVEHDRDTLSSADHVVDFGPGAGEAGGRIVATGAPDALARMEASLTGRYLSGRSAIPVPQRRRPVDGRWLTVRGARGHNLKNIDVAIPLGALVCVTGVSGSGKSTLVEETLHPALARVLQRARAVPADHDALEGLGHVDKVINIDQSPIGQSPRSNPATYVGALTPIRGMFAQVPAARARGYKPRRFSFNVPGGRCEACGGHGSRRIEMHFLPDVWITCDECGGSRFNRETLDVRYKGKTIADVLDMSVEAALEHFGSVPELVKILGTLADVGLGYIRLGQSATTLSGGEAQRVKLARELARPATGKTLYILDEPTTGLHLEDTRKLLDVLGRLVDRGNTVLVVEHNLDVVKTADWIIDLGPEGGDRGGKVVARGAPKDIIRKDTQSYTARFLKPFLSARSHLPTDEQH